MDINQFSGDGVGAVDGPARATMNGPSSRWDGYVALHVGFGVLQVLCVLAVLAIGAALSLFLGSGQAGAPAPAQAPHSVIRMVTGAALLAVPFFTLYAIIVPLLRRRMDWTSLAGSVGILVSLLAYAATTRSWLIILVVTLVYLLFGVIPFVRAAQRAPARPASVRT